jgi:DNA polymerase
MLGRVLSIDFETRSTVDLKKTGVYPYAAHEHTSLWCFAWAFDDEEPQIWRAYGPGDEVDLALGILSKPDPFPDAIRAHIELGGEMRAWNAQFERIIWRCVGVQRFDFPPVADEQWFCTAVEAAAMSLPRSLDQCAVVTGIAQQKDAAGYRLMMQMAKPRKVLADGTPVWWDVEEKKERLYAYCMQDVRTERAAYHVTRRLTPAEREVYLLDQRINDRGITLDRELVYAATDVVNEAIERAEAVLAEATDGFVTKVTAAPAMREWLASRGVPMASIAKDQVAAALKGELPPDVRTLLSVRADAGRSSVGKLTSMLKVAGDTDLLRGLYLYHGAGTGRWSGRLVQTQNFPRGDVPNAEQYIDLVLARDFDTLDLLHNPIAVVSSQLRAMLRARPGHDLIAGDLSAIEAVMLNWLAGQEDMVENFRAYFAGDNDRDPYRVNGSRYYKIPLSEVKKFPHRHTGKFIELGFGFGMGEEKAKEQGEKTYGIIMTLEEALGAKKFYRETHPENVQFWDDANNAAIEAVAHPGTVVTFGAHRNIRFVQRGKYLYLLLPSGRPLVYPAPKIVERPTPWGDTQPAVQIWEVNAKTRQWMPRSLYGGLIVENIVQAASRDVLVNSMLNLEAAGYPIVMHVHDEAVSEVPKGFGDIEEFTTLMTTLPEWAKGLPVKTEVWRGERYRK